MALDIPRQSRKCLLCHQTVNESVSLFSFPRDDRIEAWATFCKLSKDNILQHHRLCSRHFEVNSFKFTVEKGKKLTLKNSAIPSVYCTEKTTPVESATSLSTDELQLLSHKRKYQKLQSLESDTSAVNSHKAKKICTICGIIGPDVSNFWFPRDPLFSNQWAEFAEIENNEVQGKRLCENHFQKTDFRNTCGRPLLKRNCIPTLLKGNKRAKLSILNNDPLDIDLDSMSATEEPSTFIEDDNSSLFTMMPTSDTTFNIHHSMQVTKPNIQNSSFVLSPEAIARMNTIENVRIHSDASTQTFEDNILCQHICAVCESDHYSTDKFIKTLTDASTQTVSNEVSSLNIPTQEIVAVTPAISTPTTRTRRYRYVGDFSIPEMSDVRVARKLLHISRCLKDKFEKSQEQVRRLKKKVKKLEEIKIENLLAAQEMVHFLLE